MRLPSCWSLGLKAGRGGGMRDQPSSLVESSSQVGCVPESGLSASGARSRERSGERATHVGGKLTALGDYRMRHAQYRSDPLLHGMHAQCPWFVTWDDHELENNYADAVSERKGVTAEVFLRQRAAAYRAYYEAMPLRRSCLPRGSDMTLYRTASFGQLAEFLVLDTRQYRSDQPNNDRASPLNVSALDKTQTMLGRQQKNWLSGKLIQSQANWNILAQQVMMGMVGYVRGENEPV